MKLMSIANISSGPNSREIGTRFNGEKTYSTYDLEKDLYQGFRLDSVFNSKEPIVKAGDLIINTMSYNAGVVSPKNEGKVMPQNLIRLGIDNSNVDTWYLCYVLNESQKVKYQLHRSLEGSIIRRLTSSSIKSLDIKLPSIAKQRELGEVYRRMLVQIRLSKEHSEKLKKAVLATLNKEDINGGNKNAN